jgi:hypothetical protein
MNCKCGYSGLAEVGNYISRKFSKDGSPISFRCQRCKSSESIVYINSIDSVREALIRPNGRTVSFYTGGGDHGFIGYSITDKNNFGVGSTISFQEYEDLLKEMDGKLNLSKITHNVDSALNDNIFEYDEFR